MKSNENLNNDIKIKFVINQHVIVLNKLKDYNYLNDNINLPLISLQLNKIFSWSNAINQQNFKEIEIYIYIN